jgi:hypothetical protein
MQRSRLAIVAPNLAKSGVVSFVGNVLCAKGSAVRLSAFAMSVTRFHADLCHKSCEN